MIWTNEQKKLLFSDMTNAEISEATGRTVTSIKKARYYYTGHEVELAKAKLETEERELLKLEREAKRLENEKRLKELCRRLGVRLYG